MENNNQIEASEATGTAAAVSKARGHGEIRVTQVESLTEPVSKSGDNDAD